MMNDDIIQKRSQLGQIGEKIIRNMFSRQGKIVEDALDVYDSTKDMVIYDVESDDEDSITLNINGKTVEVKTQTPYVRYKAVSIRNNQLTKCKNVDELYFVTVPHPNPKLDYEYSGWILKIDPKQFDYFKYTQNDDNQPSGKRYMLGIPVRQKATTRIRKLTDEEIKELVKYSTVR